MKTLQHLAARWWLCCAGALHAPAAMADCMLEIPATVVLGRYDPAATQATPESWQLTVRSRNPKTGCRARLQVETADQTSNLLSLGNDPTGLRVTLSQDAAGRQAIPVAPQDMTSVQLDLDRQASMVLWATRGTGQWISPGLYRGSLRLTLLDEQGQTLDRRDVEFKSMIHSVVHAQFGQSNSASGLNSTRLDFGELRQGARRSAALAVQANTGYTITLSSANGGRLVHNSLAQGRVAYQLRLDGRPVALNQPIAGLSANRPGRQSHDIEVEIGSMQQVLAGEYRDSLLITISGQ
ncbi:hypothetical protein [Malikia sp.]|uniref:hypothetical protein n=1 Tax=Malikia sp. TaxID=2070706 RepID=UPI002635BAC5|nr:hypothetical protein [Malikia sp.]MDD2729945.1 hypothetical protein [Malikia sp.]